MSWFRRLLQPLIKPTESERFQSPFAIEFDPSTVSESVKASLRRNIRLISGIDKKRSQLIYEAALSSLLAGRDQDSLVMALMRIEGIAKGRAVEITRSLHNKATKQINRERQASLGITHAIWMYANAPCMANPSRPTAAGVRRDSAHRAANGKKYEIAKGLFVDGKWTWPGVERGGKCTSRAVLPWTKE